MLFRVRVLWNSILEAQATPYPDGRRVALRIELTPFQQRPNLEIKAKNATGEGVGVVSVVEAMGHRMSLTFHLRGPQPAGWHELDIRLFYQVEERGEVSVDERKIEFEIQDRSVETN